MDTSDRFSYASERYPAIKRFLIRTLEGLSGRRRLYRLYQSYLDGRHPGEGVFDCAIRLLRLEVDVRPDRLGQIPGTGPVVVVANHPFGVIDGLVLGHLIARRRDDFRILTHAGLCRDAGLNRYLLLIDFDPGEDSLRTNLRSRETARRLLAAGGCIGVFPAGGVSTVRRPFDRRATDADWKPFVAALVLGGAADVVPMFFHGQNSRIFQLASHVSQTARESLLLHEAKNKIAARIAVTIGDRIPAARFREIGDRRRIVDALHAATYGLERAPSRASAA